MNFNATTGSRGSQVSGRKIKRVSDVNAVGPSLPSQQFIPPGTGGGVYGAPQQQQQQQYQQFGNTTNDLYGNVPAPNYGGYPSNQQPQFNIPSQHQPFGGSNPYPQATVPTYGQPQGASYGVPSSQNFNVPTNLTAGGDAGIPPQFAMFQQPIVQDMAMQYGQKLADQGKQLVENQFEKWIPVTRLKYYFAVDNKYVINKLRLIFFPFIHADWSLKYDQDNPVQPRYDINAPDLYIPTMAYITYVVLAGLLLGMQNRFSPEQLGIQASSALAYSIFELVIYSITLYVTNVATTMKTLDLVAYAGYKFVVIVACLLVSIAFKKSGYYIALLFCILTLGFFLLRTLKAKVLHDPVQATPVGGPVTYDSYGMPQTPQNPDYSVGRKRKLYFLFLVVGCQAFLTFWLSMHLIPNGVVAATVKTS